MLKIRPFEWSDAEALFERNKEPEIQEMALTPLPKTLEETIEQYSSMMERGLMILIAEKDKKVVGDAFIRMERGRMSHVGTVGLSLKKEAWGQGIGTRLVKEAIKTAKKKGLKKLIYTTRENNKRSINLAKSLKFVFVGRMEKHIKSGRKYYDRLIFEKLL